MLLTPFNNKQTYPGTTMIIQAYNAYKKYSTPYNCTGNHDEDVINQAVADMEAAGIDGHIHLTDGLYRWGDENILITNPRIRLTGEGLATKIYSTAQSSGYFLRYAAPSDTAALQVDALWFNGALGTNTGFLNATVGAGTIKDVWLTRLVMYQFNAEAVIKLNNCWGLNFEDNIIEGCAADVLWVKCLVVKTTGIITKNKLSGNYGNAIVTERCGSLRIINNQFDCRDNTSYCIKLLTNSDRATVALNKFELGAGFNGNGLYIDGTSDACSINKNDFKRASGTNLVAVDIANGALAVSLENNNFLGSWPTNISDPGSAIITKKGNFSDNDATVNNDKIYASAFIPNAATKVTPVDADTVGLFDSEAVAPNTNILKKVTWVNIKAVLKTYFDTLYATLGANSNITSLSGLTTPLTIAQGGTGNAYGLPTKILAQYSQVLAPADTNENTLWTGVVPGGLLGANGRLLITCLFSFTNTTNSKTLRIKFGGSTINSTLISTALYGYSLGVMLFNRNSESVQLGTFYSGNHYGAISNTVKTYAIDTSQNETITITGQKATAGEALALEAVSVEVLK